VHKTLTAAVTSEPSPRVFTPRFPSTARRCMRSARTRDSDGLKTDVFCEHRAPMKYRTAANRRNGRNRTTCQFATITTYVLIPPVNYPAYYMSNHDLINPACMGSGLDQPRAHWIRACMHACMHACVSNQLESTRITRMLARNFTIACAVNARTSQTTTCTCEAHACKPVKQTYQGACSA
jgi:hypothetical protein